MANTPNKNSVLNKDSRYVNGGNTEVFPTRLGYWQRIVFPLANDDLFVTLTPRYNQRPYALAKDIYGKDTYAWVVLQYNNIIDINEEFVTGAIMRLPTFQRFSLVILTQKTGGTLA